MHILPAYFTTTNTRKRKKSKKPASLIEAERQHAKFLQKMRVNLESPHGGNGRHDRLKICFHVGSVG